VAEAPVDDQEAADKAAAEKAAQMAAEQAAADKAAAEKAAMAAADQAASDQADAEQAAIDAAVAAASGVGEASANDGPKGPPMTSSEIGDLHRAIETKWNVGALSTEAQQVVIKVEVELSRDQKPVTITLVSGEGGSDVAIKRAFDAARSAIFRASTAGFNLPPEKYDDWKELVMTFDPRNGLN
jgi:prolyl oligopeptidase PreP (S9A serine peptidase family)